MVAFRIGNALLRTFPGFPICRGMTAIAMASDMRRMTVQRWMILSPGRDESQQHEQREPATYTGEGNGPASAQSEWRQWKGPSGPTGWACYISEGATVSHAT